MRIVKALVLGPLLGHLVLGGCGDSSDIEPTITQSARVVIDSTTLRTTCGLAATSYVGEVAPIDGGAGRVTSSCACKYTTSGDAVGCSDAKRCTSNYDVGADNPTVCTDSEAPEDILDVTASTDRPDCTVTAVVHADHPSSFTISLVCNSAGDVSVTVVARTRIGEARQSSTIHELVKNGPCPSVIADAGSTGDPSDGGDASDAD